MEYVSAGRLEQRLGLSNIFVWVLILQQFESVGVAQQMLLFCGIMGAMALRGIFIFAGAALINAFEWLLYLFGALVIVSGIRLLLKKDSSKNIGDSKLLRLLPRERPGRNCAADLPVLAEDLEAAIAGRHERRVHVEPDGPPPRLIQTGRGPWRGRGG